MHDNASGCDYIKDYAGQIVTLLIGLLSAPQHCKASQETYSRCEKIFIVFLRAKKLSPGCEIKASLSVDINCGNPVTGGECIEE